jgi:hypothetical protein
VDVRDWLYPYYCGAGRGAREKFKQTSKHWRKRVFRWLRWLFAAVALGIYIAARADHAISTGWWLGVALGGVLAIYAALRESPPPYIENWRTGLEGEQRTAKALAPLRRRGYVVFHDLPDRRTGERDQNGNIDHVVVSTAGVFLIDSKSLGGEASIDGENVHVQMLDDEEKSYDLRRLARSVRGLAVRLKEDIDPTGSTDVQAVVVFWNPFPAGVTYGHRIVYLHGERFAGWLQAQAPQIAPEMVARLVAAIEQARPRENRTRWERLAAFDFRRRKAAAELPTVGHAAPRA